MEKQPRESVIVSNTKVKKMSEKLIYKVIFINHDEVYEIYAKSVYEGDMYGFLVVEDFIFGEKSAIVIDPSEEKLKVEFEGVTRTFIPMHEIIRIDQVQKRGVAKIVAAPKETGSNVSTLYTPEKK
jgi:hypothetical protein